MKKLPLLVERSVRESRIARSRFASDFEHEQRRSTAPPTCLKGCNHCCYYPVLLTVLEGIDLFRWLAKEHLWSHDLKQAFLENTKKTWGQSIEVWTLTMIPCPLLKDGLCTAYKKRPFVCRITLSKGDPHYCHPHRINDVDTQLVSRKEWLERLERVDTELLRRHKLAHVYIPLSTAVLYGEKVSKESVELADIDLHLWADFLKDG
jgi:Fe-S-cluster containining protein